MSDDAWRSRAGWSHYVAEPRGGADVGFAVAEAARYQVEECVGRGGMGEVVRAFDHKLQRDVAIKRIPVEGHAMLAQRLVREAWITARLDHPSIVPIYDAGIDELGQPYYAMRLIAGGTLAHAIKGAPTHPSVPLLRHFLAASQAIAFAHNHGIVHGDLKPANIMVGPFGETQVVDWGLAVELADDVRSSVVNPGAFTSKVTDGTPAYMSPEQARGEQVDARADVWALGIILRELTTGILGTEQKPVPMAKVDELEGSAAAGPVELRAMVAKATATELQRRYPSAAGFAADLERYLDGKRVMAHEYSTRELFVRALIRLRWPLAALGLVLVIGAFIFSLSYVNIRRARNRAITAEAKTAQALQANQRATSWALAQQAVIELEGGAHAEAAHLAAMALAQHESPVARGVLMGTEAAAHPIATSAWRIPGCTRVMPLAEDQALCWEAMAITRWHRGEPQPRWRTELVARRLLTLPRERIAIVAGTNQIIVLSATSGAILYTYQIRVSTGFANVLAATTDGDWLLASEGRVVSIIDLNARQIHDLDRVTPSCAVGAVAPQHHVFWLICNDGEVRTLDATSLQQQHVMQSPQVAQINPVRADLVDTNLIIGGIRGEIVELNLVSRTANVAHKPLRGAITLLQYDGRAKRVWLAEEGRGAGLFDIASGIELLRLPRNTSQTLTLHHGAYISGGQVAAMWRLPSPLSPRRWQLDVPLASFALAKAHSGVALGLSDGRLQLRKLDLGHLDLERSLGTGVTKTLGYARDMTQLAYSISVAPGGPEVLSLATGETAALPMPAPARRSARRLLFDSENRLLAVHWKPPLSVWSRHEGLREYASPEFIDADSDSTGARVWLLAVDGRLWLWRAAAAQLAPVATTPGAVLVAALPRSEGAIVCTERTCRSALANDARVYQTDESQLTDVVVSPDEQLVVGARIDGAIVVWNALSTNLLAIMRGHRERVAQLGFADADTLYSAGWDGQFLRWSVGALSADGATLLGAARQGYPWTLSATASE